jgi:hypothetical protein
MLFASEEFSRCGTKPRSRGALHCSVHMLRYYGQAWQISVAPYLRLWGTFRVAINHLPFHSRGGTASTASSPWFEPLNEGELNEQSHTVLPRVVGPSPDFLAIVRTIYVILNRNALIVQVCTAFANSLNLFRSRFQARNLRVFGKMRRACPMRRLSANL